MIIVHGWKQLTIITKRSILDVAAALDPPLVVIDSKNFYSQILYLIIKISVVDCQ